MRGWPTSSRCSYCTGESAPITGERGSASGRVLRTSEYRAPADGAGGLLRADRRARRVGHGDRGLAAEPGQRERPARVDLADPRRVHPGAAGDAAEACLAGTRVQAFDQADGVDQAGLLDEQALEQVDARVEVPVDVAHHVVDGGALLDDLADARDDPVEALRDLAQGGDGRDEVVDERQHDGQRREQRHPGRAAHAVAPSASSRMTSSEPP